MRSASAGPNREDALPEYANASGTELLLIRHGETEWNRERRIQGHTDVVLSALGREQASRLALRLAGEPIAAIYSSDLSRASQTAAPLAQATGLAVQLAPELREVGFGVWEGLTVDEVARGWPEEYAAWRQDSVRSRPPEGEAIEALQARSMAFVTELLAVHPGEKIAVVGHGGSIKAILCGFMGFTLTLWRRLRVDNSSVSRLLITSLGPTLTAYNDTCHLG